MRIAFYAPLNDPDDAKPSGDRLIARMLVRALANSKHDVFTASTLKSYDDGRDPERQGFIEEIGDRIARQLMARYNLVPDTAPQIWLTYHLYHKAPDWIGPPVAAALGIPYVVVEASYAAKQAGGPWASGHAAVENALRQANTVIGFNSQDAEGVVPRLQEPDRYIQAKAFIDTTAFVSAAGDKERSRKRLREAVGVAEGTSILLAVGMMRQGSKLASYNALAQALALTPHAPWHLVIVGDGEAEPDVRGAFAAFEGRVTFLGRKSEAELPAIYSGSDLLVWPAIKEAIGMCFLEAQAAGLPVVGAKSQGVPDVVANGVTGLLPAYRNPRDFAEAVITLLADPAKLGGMSQAATAHALANHDLKSSGRAFARAVESAIDPRARMRQKGFRR